MEEMNIPELASLYVFDLLESRLSGDMRFHNWHHTEQVVLSTIEISQHCNLTQEERSIVQTAAWFHDTGYAFNYIGHEDSGMAIAGTFLTQLNCDRDYITAVTDCINTTRMPQQPENMLQMILCDADLFHFARRDYPQYAELLREEWALTLHKSFTDAEWQQINHDLLSTHRYFTTYGKTILEARKQINVQKLKLS